MNFMISGSDKVVYFFHIFSYFSVKTYVVGTHYYYLGEAILMTTPNILFYEELKKIVFLNYQIPIYLICFTQ